MPEIHDDELGTIAIRKTANSKSMKATVAPNGSLRISVPAYTPMLMIRRMIKTMRPELRRLLNSRPALRLYDGMPIGKRHTLIIRRGSKQSLQLSGSSLILTVSPDTTLEDDEVISLVRQELIGLLRKEAKAQLPNRIAFLAEQHGYKYRSLRFTHAISRWGSCNSNKAISLNIGLMKLPYELIDYVLIHELTHTVYLNHSSAFWAAVAVADPKYLAHKKALKAYSPGV